MNEDTHMCVCMRVCECREIPVTAAATGVRDAAGGDVSPPCPQFREMLDPPTVPTAATATVNEKTKHTADKEHAAVDCVVSVCVHFETLICEHTHIDVEIFTHTHTHTHTHHCGCVEMHTHAWRHPRTHRRVCGGVCERGDGTGEGLFTPQQTTGEERERHRHTEEREGVEDGV